MFEPTTKPLAHRSVFYKRLFHFWIMGTGLLIFSIFLGTTGFMYFGHMDLINGFYNASMILTGMGPTQEVQSESTKLFASFYALYSGIVFLSSISIVFAPIIHRFFHFIHLDNRN